MNTLELTTAGLFLFLTMIAWGAAIVVVWLIDRLWVWIAGGWPDNPWYYRLDWILNAFYFVAVVASFNFMYRAFEYFLA